ncbi:MAG TPA: lipopolysaccharide transport periplasmic protein LptA [Rhodocyclaceae bacterium]|nr:lipopolysaccharide transport periplasmic protein LptA [Rhodocyclaceae bacterium]
MKINSPLRALLLSALAAAFALPALAERADKGKPIQLEAQRITVDDAKKTQVLEGNVVLTQGTLMIQSDKIVISEDKYGFQRGVATGGKNGLARIRQKREGKDEYVEGEAERIEYNTRNEVAELFRRAWVKSGEDQVKGDYIWYDAISEKYMASAGDGRDPKAPPQRVRVIIQPKSKGAAPEESTTGKGEPLDLKEAGKLDSKPQREE